jgi:hypothetical protein
MQANGVYTWTHPLKYSDEDLVDHDTPCCEHGYSRVIRAKRGREKGIDLRIGLDMLRLARQGCYDVASLVTQDTDLNQAVEELMVLRNELDVWLACETAYPFNPASGYRQFRLLSCRRWHVIDEALFGRIRDDTDYR